MKKNKKNKSNTIKASETWTNSLS